MRSHVPQEIKTTMHLFAHLNLIHTFLSPLQTNKNNVFSMNIGTEEGIILVFSGVTSGGLGRLLAHAHCMRCPNAFIDSESVK